MTVMVVVEDWEGLLWVCVRAWLGMIAVGAAAALEAISPVEGEVFVLLILVVGGFCCAAWWFVEEWEDMRWSGEKERERERDDQLLVSTTNVQQTVTDER